MSALDFPQGSREPWALHFPWDVPGLCLLWSTLVFIDEKVFVTLYLSDSNHGWAMSTQREKEMPIVHTETEATRQKETPARVSQVTEARNTETKYC